MQLVPRRPARVATASTALVITSILLAACGGSPSAIDTTVAPTTTAAPTTSSSTTTTSTTTAATTTTVTLPPLPVIESVPPRGTQEPEVILGTIEIPAIGLETTLYEGISLSTLDRGPGHWPGSAMPGGYGNTVIGGHRTSHTRPFYFLDQLVEGDEIILTTEQGRFVYEVTVSYIVDPDDNWVIAQTPGYRLTLFACHPLHSSKQRIIVRALLRDA